MGDPALAAEPVVQVLGAVDAQADVEGVLLEELAPGLVQQHAVGLEFVPDALRAAYFSLELDHLPIEIEAQQRRLAAVPVEEDLVDLLAGDVLADEELEGAALGEIRRKVSR